MFGLKRKKSKTVVGYSYGEQKEFSHRLTEEQIKDINQRVQEIWDKMEENQETNEAKLDE